MIDWFLPGYKAGGQIRSCANMATALHNEFDIYVITSDRDLGDNHTYSGILPDEWNTLDNGLKVFYISHQHLNYSFIKKLIVEVQPGRIYLNSMFSWKFTVLPLLAGLTSYKNRRIILAPRGMLHEGALQYKKVKKKVFINAFKIAGLHKRITFHATDETERKDIHHTFGNRAEIRLVQDFNTSTQQPFQTIEKNAGELKCLFVSRIAPKKNLLYLLSLLAQVTVSLHLVIVGPVEEESYWNECRQAITRLPANVSVSQVGAIPHAQLEKVYLDHHIFILPTFGENFGHVIFESLLHGRPVLTSDKTPWHNLEEKKAGWTVSLQNPEGFLEVIRTAAAWTQEAFEEHAGAAWRYAQGYIREAGLTNKYVDLFS